MALPLSILKNVLNLNHNFMHVTNCEQETVTIHRHGETYEQTRIYVHARPYKRVHKPCPICHKKCPGYDTKYSTESTWRAPNLNGVPVYICYRPQRIECPEHGVLTEYIPWADGNSRFTEDFCNEVAWMVCRMSKTAVALFEGINWRTVGNCVKAAHNRLEPDITVRMHDLRRICVDETSYRKGHAYITVVYDMDRNRVVWVHEGHGLEIFRLFCEKLSPEERAKIQIVAGDGAKWIDTCTKEYFPNATRCIDFFHIVEWAVEKLDKVRIATASKAAREYDRRKQEFQTAEELRREAEDELAAMPKHGRPSRRKQELIAFLNGEIPTLPPQNSSSKQKGRRRKEALSISGLKPMAELSEKIKRHRKSILNSVRFQANSARSEAVNTSIKVLIKMAREFHNIENMIYLKCSDLVVPLHNRPLYIPKPQSTLHGQCEQAFR